MRALVLAILLVGCNNNATSKAPDAPASSTPTTASTEVAPTGTGVTIADDAIKQAVTQKQDVLIVKVKDIQTGGAGSRSELTTYTLEIVKSISGGQTGSIKLSAYGAPVLAKDKTYAVTTRGGNPAWGTKGLKETVEVPAGQEDATAAGLAKKVADVGK